MRTSALGFIEPCLPTVSRTVPTGAGWAYEIKHDGFRFMCRRHGDRVRVFSLTTGPANCPPSSRRCVRFRLWPLSGYCTSSWGGRKLRGVVFSLSSALCAAVFIERSVASAAGRRL
jgi:hypothetical protein